MSRTQVHDCFRHFQGDQKMSILTNVLRVNQKAEERKSLQMCLQPWGEIVETPSANCQRMCRLVTVKLNTSPPMTCQWDTFLPRLCQNWFQLMKNTLLAQDLFHCALRRLGQFEVLEENTFPRCYAVGLNPESCGWKTRILITQAWLNISYDDC